MISNERSLRDALGQFATGVCVVTAKPAKKPAFGLTVNSFSSVSLEPPLVLWSIGKHSRSFNDFMSVERYTINVLSADQKDLSAKFAGKDRLLTDDHIDLSIPEFPSIDGSIARFHCEVAHRYDGGDHLIIVGRVLNFCSANTTQPLIFLPAAIAIWQLDTSFNEQKQRRHLMITHNKLIGRAREFAPQVEKEAADTEKDGRISSELLGQFCDAGFMEILVPKRFGGHEMNYGTFANVIKEIAPYCTSTAWVLSFYIGHNYIHALFPETSQEEVFADKPYALTPGTIAPSFTLTPYKDGYIASGKSSWNSGSAHSDWYIASGMINREGQPPEFRVFLVPTKDAIYIENWDVAGMRGTSSSDMQLQDVFIPEYHTALTTDIMDGRSPGSKVHANPMYSLLWVPLLWARLFRLLSEPFVVPPTHLKH